MKCIFKSSRSGLASALIGASALAGCANLSDERFPFNEGWREAEVLEVGPISQISRPDFYTCIRNASTSEQRPAAQYVIVKYKRMGRSARHAQPLQVDQQWSAGEKVYVKVSECTGQIVPRSE